MNVQFPSLFSSNCLFFSPLKEKVSFALTNKQKAIMAVAFLAFLLVAACYSLLGRCCNFRASKISDDHDDESSSKDVFLDTGMVIEGLPDEIITQIFDKLNLQSWRQLANTNKHLNQISKTPEVISNLLVSQEVPPMQRLELAKQAGQYLTKFSFEGLTLTRKTLQELLRVCPKVEELDLSFKEVSHFIKSGLTAADLALLPKLKSLKLGNWRTLTAADLANLFQAQTSLESLDLTSCPFVTNASLMHLPKSLKVLNLEECWLVTYKDIKRFQNLESLVLNQNYPQPNKLNMAKLPRSLESLTLGGFQLESKDLEQLPQGLKSLDLVAGGLNDFNTIQLPPGLKSLILRGVHYANPQKQLPLLLEGLDSLESFELSLKSNSSLITLFSTPQFKSLPLKHLILKDFSLLIEDKHLTYLPSDLESLSLIATNGGVTDVGLIQLLKRLKSLRFLNLFMNYQLTDRIVDHFPKTLECLICPDGRKVKDLSKAKEHFYKSRTWWPF